VRPILEAAGFHLDVRETQGPGHATDIVKEAELQNFDAVVAVGGDGTIFEILQVRQTFVVHSMAIESHAANLS